MVSVLENSMRPKMKGTIPVVSFKPIIGHGFESLREAKYETNDIIVSSKKLNLEQNGKVTIQGYNDEFRLTPFAATGFAWCSLSEDRPCETEDAAYYISKGFQSQEKEWRLRITENNVIIAIVSPSYIPLQNSVVVDGVLKLSNNFDPTSFWSLHPEDLRIAIQSKKSFSHNGETFFGGSLIKNGEHGKQQFSAMGRLVQQICANGMVIGFGESVDIFKKHKNEQNWEGFDVMAAVSQIVTKAIEVGGFIDHMEELWFRNDNQRDLTLKKIVAMDQLGPEQSKGLITSYNHQRELRSRKSETMYDVFNAVTGLKDQFPKTRLRWEELGGNLLLSPEQYYHSLN